MSVLVNAKIDALLEATSRSFYPTLKYLPKKIRGQIGLLYLLARVADTIADSKHGETETLLDLLKSYNDVAQGRSDTLPDFSHIAKIQTNENEAKLLQNVEDVVDGLGVYGEEDQQRILEYLRFGRCYIPSDALARHGLKPEDLLDHTNIDRFRPLYDEYLDIANGHFEAAVEYIRMLPEGQFRLKASCMLPVLIGQRTVTLLRTGNILNSEERIKVTRDEIKAYAKRLPRALLIPGGVKRLLEKNKDAPK